MRIVFAAWRDLANENAGGSEVLIDRIASGLTARGHDVALLCAGPIAERSYRVVDNGGRHTQFLRAPFAYRRHLSGADLVVDVANGMPYLVPLWHRGASMCFVNHVHTRQWDQWFPAPVAALGRTVESRAMPWVYRNRLFVAVSPSTAVGLEGMGVRRDDIRLVYNGVDVPAAVMPKSTEPSFVAAGRFVPHKRFDLLARLWERVRPHTGGRLTIMGDGMLYDDLRATAGPGLYLPGRVSEEEKGRLYGEAWALLHPASFEGWGLVISEAAAAGTPAIGFRVPGVRDSIVDGRTGLLADDEDAFVERWIALTHDAELRARLGAAARERAMDFSGDSTVDQFEAVAMEAVHGRTRTPQRSAIVRPTTVSSARVAAVPATRVPVSIVVPARDEAHRLPATLPRLLAAASELGAELIVVDDGSTDATASIVAAGIDGNDRAELIMLDRHLGKGAAVRAGVARARGAAICFMDADLATDLADLPRLVAGLDNAHLVIGSRATPGSVVTGAGAVRIAMGRSFNALTRTASGLAWRDTQCGFKAFRAPVAKLLFDLSSEDGFAFDLEILALADRIGYRVAELPVRWHDVPGSHIRAGDPMSMAISALRIGTRARTGRVLTSLRAWRGNGRPVGELVDELRGHLDGSPSVVRYGAGALALLPFVAPEASRELAVDLRSRLPGVVVEPSVVTAGLLFDPAGDELRAALVGA